ncbi:MAG: hypothetical protein KGL46_13780 [Hyphomicrobiales bacterium]|nr:hypothetical protein [Hyphomicrobiales bacterium]
MQRWASIWREIQGLKSRADCERFVAAAPEKLPIRSISYRFWEFWRLDRPAEIRFRNIAPESLAFLRYANALPDKKLDHLMLARVAPVDWREEIDRQTQIGVLLQPLLKRGYSLNVATFIVHGPYWQCSLLIGDLGPTVDEETRAACFANMQLMAHYLHASVVRNVLPPPSIQLSPREAQCLRLAALGKTTKESAKILGLSDQTVTAYLANLRKRLGAANTTEAVAKALGFGLFSCAEFSPPPMARAS